MYSNDAIENRIEEQKNKTEVVGGQQIGFPKKNRFKTMNDEDKLAVPKKEVGVFFSFFPTALPVCVLNIMDSKGAEAEVGGALPPEVDRTLPF